MNKNACLFSLVKFEYFFQITMANLGNVADVLNSPSLTKQKLQVMLIKHQDFGDKQYHFIYLSSEAARIVILLNEEVLI